MTALVSRRAFDARRASYRVVELAYPPSGVADEFIRTFTPEGAVRMVDGFGHELGERPGVVIPLIRECLDPLPRRRS